PAWPLKYDVQLIGQSEDTKMRFHPKGGIEHRQYLRLKNVVASVRGFPRQGGLRVGQGKTCQTLNFSQCCAKSVANQRNSIRKGSKVSQQRHRRYEGFLLKPASRCLVGPRWSDDRQCIRAQQPHTDGGVVLGQAVEEGSSRPASR